MEPIERPDKRIQVRSRSKPSSWYRLLFLLTISLIKAAMSPARPQKHHTELGNCVLRLRSAIRCPGEKLAVCASPKLASSLFPGLHFNAFYGGKSLQINNPGGRVRHESVRTAPRWQTSAWGPQRPGVSSDQPAFWLTRSPAVSAAFWVRTRGSRGLLDCHHCGRGFPSPPRDKSTESVLWGKGPYFAPSFRSGLTALGLGVPQNRIEWTQIGGGKVSPRRLQAEKREKVKSPK